MNHYNFEIADGIATITFDLPGKVNVMNDDFLIAIKSVFADLDAVGPQLAGVILRSAKSTFFAGGDLTLLGSAKAGQEEMLFNHFQILKSYFRRLETIGVPVVAVLNGSALGGGLELALACHHRICVADEHIQIGLPEICYALLPGAGGVVRLSRLLGLNNALPYLLSGQRVTPQKALEDGIVDELAVNEEAALQAATQWIGANPSARQPWDQTGHIGSHALSATQRSAVAASQIVATTHCDKDAHAVMRIADLAVQAIYLQPDAALRAESRGLVELMLRPAAGQLIANFFSSRATAKG